MKNFRRLTGLIAATHTPLKADGSLNLAQVKPMVDYLERQGVSGLFVCGSTGEGPLLTMDERRATAEAFCQAARGRLPAVVHVGHSSLAEGRVLAAHAAKIGADAIAAIAPYYFKPNSVDVLIDSMAELASGAPDLPFYYYHIPVLTGVALDVADLLRRGPQRIPNLAGVKYTAPTVDELQIMLALEGGRFDVLFGRDEMLLSGLAAGVRGAVGTTYNYAAPLYRRLIEAFDRGDLAKARECQIKAVQFIQILLRQQTLAASKEMMRMVGIDCGPVRLPLVNLKPEQAAQFRRDLEAIGFFDWGCK